MNKKQQLVGLLLVFIVCLSASIWLDLKLSNTLDQALVIPERSYVTIGQKKYEGLMVEGETDRRNSIIELTGKSNINFVSFGIVTSSKLNSSGYLQEQLLRAVFLSEDAASKLVGTTLSEMENWIIARPGLDLEKLGSKDIRSFRNVEANLKGTYDVDVVLPFRTLYKYTTDNTAEDAEYISYQLPISFYLIEVKNPSKAKHLVDSINCENCSDKFFAVPGIVSDSLSAKKIIKSIDDLTSIRILIYFLLMGLTVSIFAQAKVYVLENFERIMAEGKSQVVKFFPGFFLLFSAVCYCMVALVAKSKIQANTFFIGSLFMLLCVAVYALCEFRVTIFPKQTVFRRIQKPALLLSISIVSVSLVAIILTSVKGITESSSWERTIGWFEGYSFVNLTSRESYEFAFTFDSYVDAREALNDVAIMSIERDVFSCSRPFQVSEKSLNTSKYGKNGLSVPLYQVSRSFMSDVLRAENIDMGYHLVAGETGFNGALYNSFGKVEYLETDIEKAIAPSYIAGPVVIEVVESCEYGSYYRFLARDVDSSVILEHAKYLDESGSPYVVEIVPAEHLFSNELIEIRKLLKSSRDISFYVILISTIALVLLFSITARFISSWIKIVSIEGWSYIQVTARATVFNWVVLSLIILNHELFIFRLDFTLTQFLGLIFIVSLMPPLVVGWARSRMFT